jgi:Type IX secretion system protein PorV
MKLNALCSALAVTFSLSQTVEAQCIQVGNNRLQSDGTPCNNTILTALPFLRITPDARFGALGDAGIALNPDANSLHFNASHLAFAEKDFSISATYTPWLRALGLTDVYLTHLAMYKNVDKFQTVGGSLRFFSLGQIQFTDDQGNALQTVRPRELELNFAYARKLTKTFSSALSVKYLFSNLGQGTSASGDVLRPAHGFAADVSFTYKKPFKLKNGKTAVYTSALALSNIGTKISYVKSANRDYIPAMMGFGNSFEYEIDEYNSVTFALDITKLMVPTPVPATLQTVDTNGDTIFTSNPAYNANGNAVADYRELSVPSSILRSFHDASFKEELQELAFSFGMEYWYNKQFALRLGHYNENKTKGNRKYVTVGLGIKYTNFCLNLSYLIPTFNAQRNPLDNTLRFSLMMDFGQSKAAPKRPKATKKEEKPKETNPDDENPED